MLKTKGGYIIFDLMSLVLAVTESATDIEDESILKQLYSLLPYFLNKEEQLKPIYLRVKDSDGVESTVLAELVRSDAGIKIHAKVLDSDLVINVAFEQDADTLEWSIDSATYDYLSDSSIIEGIIESGLVENAKPIYCHPIQMDLQTESVYDGKITMLIFTNDGTPFTKSTFITWLQNLFEEVGETIRIMISGAFNQSNTTCIASYLAKTSNNPLILVGWSINGTEVNRSYASNIAFLDAILSFNDGVNKIN